MERSIVRPGIVAAFTLIMTACGSSTLDYPETRKGDQVDDYFGTEVADPYRWLEDDTSAETAAWVEAQNQVTNAYLAGVAGRDAIRSRLTSLWNYERFGVPERQGDLYVYSRNDGLQNQSVVYKTADLHRDGDVLLDPNVLSPDGTVALVDRAFTADGRLMVYALSESGSDWREWRVRDVQSDEDLRDVVRWSKFAGAAWLPDRTGFFYSRFAEPGPDTELSGVNQNQQVFLHRLGTNQARDELVHAAPDHPDWGFSTEVTEDGRFLIVHQTEGTDPRNRVLVRDLTTADGEIVPFLDAFDAEYRIVGNDGETFYVLTDQGAPRKRLVAIDRDRPDPGQWNELIPEGAGRDVLSDVIMVDDRFIATWLVDAHGQLRVYTLDGRPERDIPLPGLGSVTGVTGHRADPEAFFGFESYTRPATIYRYAVASGEVEVHREPKLTFSPEDFVTEQVFYTSLDGTRVPMFISSKTGLEQHGENPTLLYGYGGFNISMTPAFSPATIAWLEMGGLYAVANLRGGGEYGKAWHDAGRLDQKQNVFDDFIAAAEYLIAEGYTSTPRLAISGRSNGGLLVGASLTQRPDLFGAVLAGVGVMDMLRFHEFTIGWAWTSDYGSSETREGFETLIAYSPLHNLEEGTAYPATLITTADHDDRVVPAHSFKVAATMQAAQGGPEPVLIRIETSAGHGAGKPVTKQIDQATDEWAFLASELDVAVPADWDQPPS